MEICENWNQLLKEWNCLISLQPAISNSFNSFHSSLWEWEEWLNWWMLRPLAAQENVLNEKEMKFLWNENILAERGQLHCFLLLFFNLIHESNEEKEKRKQLEKNGLVGLSFSLGGYGRAARQCSAKKKKTTTPTNLLLFL